MSNQSYTSGDAPELKRDVMAARNAIQFRGAAPKTGSGTNKPSVTRNRFKGVLRECENLLKSMGVQCIKGSGEAEATCAMLNSQGCRCCMQLVDAVISQDSDCFAYGARRVYRNFSVSTAAGAGAMQGSVDCYDAAYMYESNGFGRNKMVALALLCGSDYNVGACGSSINTAVQFLHTVPESDIIPRLLSWVLDPAQFEERSRWASAPGRCDRCGHVGRTHLRNGCPVCATHRGCTDLGHKSKVAEVKRELSLRSRALSCGIPFPEPKVMKEFLHSTEEKIDIDSLKRPVPSLIQFTKLMKGKLDWSERYCVEKFLPVLTKWHLQENVPSRTIKPITIKKKRNPRGVPSYEVLWGDIDGSYDALIPDDQFDDNEDPSMAWFTTERQDLMRQYYPDVVEAYEESIKKPVKEKRPRKQKETNEDNKGKPKRKTKKPSKLVNVNKSHKSLRNNSAVLNTSVSINKLKRKIKSKKKGNQKTIDSFIARKKRKSKHSTSNLRSLRCSFKNMGLGSDVDQQTDEKENNNVNKHLLSMLNDTGGDVNESDLSAIIDDIVSRQPITKTAKVDNKLVKLVFDKYSTPKKSTLRKSMLNKVNNHCSTPKDSPIRKHSFRFSTNSFNKSLNSKVNTSYFFEKITDDRDAFEISLEYKHKSAVILDSNLTDLSLPDVQL
ncbi:flap endonuclease GEN isoform X3 [Manduca sexta]|uniref:flap endonuclease GEN isoform X3 n=1 Tax=Manduca sexta TaxID=7130 RepID=UPI00188ED5A7|nr:flap endonuclease GEN isoform X3 [Manduca sexta]